MRGSERMPPALTPQLHERYRVRLGQQMVEMEAAWARLQYDLHDWEALRTLHDTVHKIAGSGAFFGCPSLSVAAQELEALLIERLADDEGSKRPTHRLDDSRPSYDRLRHAIAEIVNIKP